MSSTLTDTRPLSTSVARKTSLSTLACSPASFRRSPGSSRSPVGRTCSAAPFTAPPAYWALPCASAAPLRAYFNPLSRATFRRRAPSLGSRNHAAVAPAAAPRMNDEILTLTPFLDLPSPIPGAEGLEPEQGGDPAARPKLVEQEPQREHLGRLLDGKLDRGLGEVLAGLQPGAVDRTGALAGGAEPAAPRAERAGGGVALVQQQRLHAPLVQRPEHVLEPGHGPRALV